MLNRLKRLAYAGMFLLPLTATALQAQVVTTPSLEGTKIKNVATATYTDANSNTYTAAKDSVSVVVGFLAAPDPSAPASATPASPSSLNVAGFTLKNSGNGVDSATVTFTAATGLTITAYTYNGTDYATLAALNAVIKLVSLPVNGTLAISVKYSVGSTYGGQTLPLTVNQYSVRTPATFYSATTNVMPPAAYNVSVTPDNATVSRLVSNGAPAYTYSFTVTNTGNTSNTYSIGATVAGPANGTVTITNVSQSSATIAAGGNTSVTVSYTVAEGTAPDKIVLSASGTSASDDGDVTVSVHKAAMTLAKRAYRLMTDLTPLDTLVAADAVTPGTGFFYKLSVSNAASAADAKSVVITDVLPAGVTFVSATPDAAGWTINHLAGTVTASLAGDLVQNTTRFIWVKVQIATTPATVVAP
jgi:uncharacterized repeat protein (TIGR01451 family)